MTALLEQWSPQVKPVYLRYPAAIRSSKWPEILALANAGKPAEAMALAASTERNKAVRAENVVARRLRLQRVAVFNLQRNAVKEIQARFKTLGTTVADRVSKRADGISTIRPLTDFMHEEIVQLRRDLNRRVTDWIWETILMSIRHMGNAIEPIFRDNRESFASELADLDLFGKFERDLREAGEDDEEDTFAVKPNLAVHASTKARLTSPKWSAITDRIYENLAKKNLEGLTLSERIWDLTDRAEKDLKRILASEIASGASPRAVADRLQQYIYVRGLDDDFQGGPGVYRSPLKNALRLTRTEIGRAYTSGSAAWAKDKSWLAGIRITLSDAHTDEDICDDKAGELVSPDEFESLVPFHPHCMCYAVYVIKEENLENEEAA